MSRHRLRTARHGEEGVALVLVLTFIALFGLLIGALLAFSGASINVTLANRGQRSRLYTAGAGIDGAVENIRGTATIGRDDGSACPTFNAGAFANNLDVSVTCAPQVGSGGGNANGPHQVPNAPAYSAWAVPPFGQLPSGTDEGVIGCGSGDAVIQGNVASTDVVTSGTGGCASGNLTVSGYTDARSEKGSVVTQGGCNCFDSDPPGDPNYPQASSTIPAPAPAPACLRPPRMVLAGQLLLRLHDPSRIHSHVGSLDRHCDRRNTQWVGSQNGGLRASTLTCLQAGARPAPHRRCSVLVRGRHEGGPRGRRAPRAVR